MIDPVVKANEKEVAAHYDELDTFYREVWGDHVHHGLWLTGEEDVEQATHQLIDLVAGLAELQEGDSVCDVGSGYGATARYLAAHRGACVTAVTLSAKQHAFAVAQGGEGVTYQRGDWLQNTFLDAAFDVVIAVESTAHMGDKRRFFEEAFRTLKPGGRAVVCAWLAGEQVPPWQRRHLLQPICVEGRLPGMGTAAEYRSWIAAAGLMLDDFYNLSSSVRRTWTLCIRRLVHKVLTDQKYLRYLLGRTQPNRHFARTLLRIWMAYRTGAMQYGVFSAHRPAR